jgi:hypothetical protein
MTCATPLSGEAPREERPWEQYRRDERSYGAGRAGRDNRFEKVGPVVEDFVFDVMRAGARLYFGVRDPEAAQDPSRRGGAKPGRADRIERIKDIIAEARVTHRNRGRRADGDRTRY